MQNSKSKNAGASWRRFEILVARIEKSLSMKGAIVKSPDILYDKITGKPREVDASIILPAGSSEILITIECRKRKHKQDVTWIEQIFTKGNDVGAAMTFAVSETGFTEAARIKAKRYGIILRKLDKINPEIFLEQFQLSSKELRYETINAVIDFYGDVPHSAELVQSEIDMTTEIFKDEKKIFSVRDNSYFSLNDIFKAFFTKAQSDNTDFWQIPINTEGYSINKRVEMSFGKNLCFKLKSMEIFIERITVDFKLFKGKPELITDATNYLYTDENNTAIVKGIEFTKKFPEGQDQVFTYLENLRTNEYKFLVGNDV